MLALMGSRNGRGKLFTETAATSAAGRRALTQSTGAAEGSQCGPHEEAP